MENPDTTPSESRRSQARPGTDRRRAHWHDFRRAYPGFVLTIAIGVIALLAINATILVKHFAYRHEIDRLRAGMTQAERQKTDLIVQAEQNKIRIALELAKQQAKFDKKLHLSVSVDSAKMYLEREGALLREIPVAFGPEKKPATAGDSIPAAIPRGERTIASASSQEIVLDGGTVISSGPLASANNSTLNPVPPGGVRISASDMQAILPNLAPGMKVYFY